MTEDTDRTDPWPWDQGPDVATITVRSVLEGAPILLVSHDADDHGWQFLDGAEPDVGEARVVAMDRFLHLDPSLRQIADLPPGWIATRSAPGQPWVRSPRPAEWGKRDD